MRIFKNTLLALIACCFLANGLKAAEYVGATACFDCHSEQYAKWQQSHHAKSMQLASNKAVLAPFKGERFELDKTTARFFQRDGAYFVSTTNAQNKVEDFAVRYTFGFYPLQQYLLETDKGRLQAFDIAWDARPKDQGGQRWFHLQAQENPQPGHPFFWQGAYQNWNSRCASCHSTDLQVGFKEQDETYQTHFSEINVACESCHGPASEHVTQARKGQWLADKGLLTLNPPTPFVFQQDLPIASPQGKSDQTEINVCGGCHSRRGQLAPAEPGASYHDTYQIQGLDANLYFANGQIKDEVFVLGSFLQSKMYEQGVRCSHCHDPHSGKTVLQGDALCAQCHNPQTFAQPQHSKHATDQVQCVDCHMSSRLYMGVDWRRDHGFHLPTSALPDEPNACLVCHDDKSMLTDTLKQWPTKKNHWAKDLAAAQHYDGRAVRYLANWIKDTATPSFVKASMLQQLAASPSRMSLELAQINLASDDPILKATAIDNLNVLPPQQRWALLQPLLGDERLRVRLALARGTADLITAVEPEAQKILLDLQREYRQSLESSSDMPSAQLGLAELALRAGDTNKARYHFEKALAIDASYLPALLNIADFERQIVSEARGQTYLQQAMLIAPDSADVNFALALSYIRQRRYDDALPYLKVAATLPNAIPHYAYVYAVALENNRDITAAITALELANQRWPYDYQLLATMIQFLDKDRRGFEAGLYVARLSEIAPNAPEVQAYWRNYKQ